MSQVLHTLGLRMLYSIIHVLHIISIILQVNLTENPQSRRIPASTRTNSGSGKTVCAAPTHATYTQHISVGEYLLVVKEFALTQGSNGSCVAFACCVHLAV